MYVSKWSKGALYTICGHYVKEAFVPTANNHQIAGRCKACKSAAGRKHKRTHGRKHKPLVPEYFGFRASYPPARSTKKYKTDSGYKYNI